MPRAVSLFFHIDRQAGSAGNWALSVIRLNMLASGGTFFPLANLQQDGSALSGTSRSQRRQRCRLAGVAGGLLADIERGE
jgi:hypothetical protein